jgi:hypothetical protein
MLIINAELAHSMIIDMIELNVLPLVSNDNYILLNYDIITWKKLIIELSVSSK